MLIKTSHNATQRSSIGYTGSCSYKPTRSWSRKWYNSLPTEAKVYLNILLKSPLQDKLANYQLKHHEIGRAQCKTEHRQRYRLQVERARNTYSTSKLGRVLFRDVIFNSVFSQLGQNMSRHKNSFDSNAEGFKSKSMRIMKFTEPFIMIIRKEPTMRVKSMLK